jgi:hypothetical protein
MSFLALCVCSTRRSRPPLELDRSTATATRAWCRSGMPDRAGSSPALRNMRPNLNITTVRHFSLFAPLALSRRPPVNLPFANENERPEHASRVGGYLQACPANCCALFEQSAGRACGVFSLCTQFILHLVLYAVEQWVRNTHDPLPAATPP